MLPLSVIILLDFRIVPTMWYFLFFISLYISCHFYISQFHLSLPFCFDPSFCSYSSGCIYAIFVLLVVFDPSMLVL
jgi:hypothetical protein